MDNSLLLLLIAIANIVFVILVARLQPHRLIGLIAVDLILVSLTGNELVSIFGFVTNIGNIFYGCAFLSTYMILEKYGRKEAIQAIWFGPLVVICFMILMKLAMSLNGMNNGEEIMTAVDNIFVFLPRIMIASILSYVFAQYINIYIYEWIKNKTKGKHLWLRANTANIVAQLLDSCVFFSIAFIDMPGDKLVQAILAGWVLKSLIVIFGTPFLYFGRRLMGVEK